MTHPCLCGHRARRHRRFMYRCEIDGCPCDRYIVDYALWPIRVARRVNYAAMSLVRRR